MLQKSNSVNQNHVSYCVFQQKQGGFCCQRQQIKLMNYNQLNFYHRNPFYKQDFLPDRAWYNRETKAYPSEIPSGKDFLPDTGRKHFMNRFNHSEIEEANVLKSAERYPFEHRIALDKTYMRNLNTIDIEGASSNTRVNQSIKNKAKALESIASRYNRSVDLKQKNEEDKRKEVAMQQYQRFKQRESRIVQTKQTNQAQINYPQQNPEIRYSPSLANDISDQYKRYIMQNSSNKFHKNIPIAKYPKNSNDYRTINASYDQYLQSPLEHRHNHTENLRNEEIPSQPSEQLPARQQKYATRGSKYQSDFDSAKMRNSEEYRKILQYEQLQRRMLKNPKQFRKSNPTNLSTSINMAGQTIVSN